MLSGRVLERRIRLERDRPERDQQTFVLESDSGAETLIVEPWNSGGRLVRRAGRSFGLDLVRGFRFGGVTRGSGELTQHDVIRSPMPGRIARLLVKAGDRVTANQTLLVLEAMKIEHLVTAPRDGVVEAVRYNEGDQVKLGAELIELED
jgi:biotin carboxyl carrier protein